MGPDFETSLWHIQCDYCHGATTVTGRTKNEALQAAHYVGWIITSDHVTFCGPYCQQRAQSLTGND